MANQWYQLKCRQLINGVSLETIWDYRIENATDQTNEFNLADAFEDNVLPLMNAVQVDVLTNVELTVFNRTDGLLVFVLPQGGGGDILALDNTNPPTQTAIYVRSNVGPTYKWSDDTLETGTPIRLGKKYIPGQNEHIMSSFGLDQAYLVTEWEAFEAAFSAPITLASSDVALPVVHGYPIARTPPLASRDEVYAQIVLANRRDISFLRSRKN